MKTDLQSARALRDATRARFRQSAQDLSTALSPAVLRARGQSAVQRRATRAIVKSQAIARRNGRALGFLLIGVAAVSAVRPIWKMIRKPKQGDSE